jgi:hypothetical protein
MELVVKSDPVTIIGQNFIVENYHEDIIQEIKFYNEVIWDDNRRKRKGISCKMEIEQSSKYGVFFELTARVNLYFDWDLLDQSLFHNILQHAQILVRDEFSDRSHVDMQKFVLPVQQLDPVTVSALYELLKR